MSFFETARDILATPHVYRCRECGAVCALNELNDEMLCSLCGEPESAEDYAPSEDELRRTESTWRV